VHTYYHFNYQLVSFMDCTETARRAETMLIPRESFVHKPCIQKREVRREFFLKHTFCNKLLEPSLVLVPVFLGDPVHLRCKNLTVCRKNKVKLKVLVLHCQN
jgi:hypothetical protein